MCIERQCKSFRTVWHSSKKGKIAHYSQSLYPAPHKATSIVNILKANLGTLFLLYNGIVQGIFLMKSFCNQDSQSFREHEQSSRLAPTSTMLVFLTFTFLFEMFWVPLFIFLFLDYIKALNRNKWLSKTSGLSPWQRFL